MCVHTIYWYLLYIVACVCLLSTYSSTCLELFVCHMSVQLAKKEGQSCRCWHSFRYFYLLLNTPGVRGDPGPWSGTGCADV